MRDEVGGALPRVDGFSEEISRRRGALAAAVGRAESRVRALEGDRSGRIGHAALRGDKGPPRLRGRRRSRARRVRRRGARREPGRGYEAPLACRARGRASGRPGHGGERGGAGKPLIECVDVTDARYTEAVRAPAHGHLRRRASRRRCERERVRGRHAGRLPPHADGCEPQARLGQLRPRGAARRLDGIPGRAEEWSRWPPLRRQGDRPGRVGPP